MFISVKIRRFFAFIGSILLQLAIVCYAGPPYNTDDPEPVELHHWEYYVSSANTFQAHELSGTLPHFEVNYGLLPHVQVHLLMPLNYDRMANQPLQYGYTNTEVGVKYCFIQETDKLPQIGTFPIILIPTLKDSRFSNGNVQLFIPLWIQKSWDKLTTYGGGGYWIRSGVTNKNSVFAGWEAQYDFLSKVTLGGELYYHSSEAVDSQSVFAFNAGGSINFTPKLHLIFSIGHSLINNPFTSTYIGLLWTI
jgi:hypothetical protein